MFRSMGEFARRLAVLAIAAVAAGCGGSFDKKDYSRLPLAPDPAGYWREVGYNGGTSICIGDPRDPSCAIDNLMACFVRQNATICGRVAGAGVARDARDYWPRTTSDQLLRYRVQDVTPSPGTSTTTLFMHGGSSWDHPLEWSMQPFDLWVDLELQACWVVEGGQRCGPVAPYLTTIQIRPEANGWKAINWQSPYDRDGASTVIP